jgi:transcriptional regulator with XRE-family HTH domain
MPKKKTPTSVSISVTTAAESQRQPIRNNVQKLRRERKWTQWQLAQISRLSQRTIQRIERGARLGITAELALATAFEVEVSKLYATGPAGIRGGEPSETPQRFQILKRLLTGAALLDVIEAGPFRFDCRVLGDEQSQAVEEFFQYINMWGALWQEIEPGERGKYCQVFQTKLDELDACDVWVFGAPASVLRSDMTNRHEGTLVFKRSDDPQIVQPKLLRQFGKAMCFITVLTDP